jgi:DNA polymerase-3 subunit delta'
MPISTQTTKKPNERAGMSFDKVLGQEHAEAMLRSARSGGRLGQSYLFSGPDGVGKTLYARTFAATVLCSAPDERPCGRCGDCHMVLSDRHPDYTLIEPLGAARAITIAQVRDLIGYLALRPVQAEHRVAVLRDADRMREEAANAILKTLEEPPGFAMLILTSSHPRNLLPTIRSRCQEVRFGLLSTDLVIEALLRAGYEDGEELRLAARLAGGSVGQAAQLLDSDALRLFDQLVPRVLAMPKEDAFDLSDDLLAWLREAGSTLEPQRDRFRQFLDILSRTYAGALRPDAPAGPTKRLPVPRLLRIVDAIWNAHRQTDSNAALDLIAQGLLERVATLQRPAPV